MVKIAVWALMLAGGSLLFSSCVGSFALSNKVLSWNRSLGNKFVNELVFFAFWVIPVYEVTLMADALVINSIEFWTGDNPLTASVKAVDTEQGRYLIACDGKGYDITFEPDGRTVRLDFSDSDRTWSVVGADGESHPFMTFVDDTHVRMTDGNGGTVLVDLSQEGVMAYREATAPLTAAIR